MNKISIKYPKVKGSNFMNGVCVVNNGMLTEYSPIEFLEEMPRLIK